jgi:hypothetical protein
LAITDKTLIPLGLAVIAIGGGSVWLTTVYAEVKTNNEKLTEVIRSQEEYNRNVAEINSRLSRIEGKLEGRKNEYR